LQGIEFDEICTFAARLEAIRILLAFVSHMDVKLLQVDVKYAFLNDFLNEEVYVEQPPGFESPEFPNHIFKLHKVFYGLKRVPSAH